MGSSPNRASSMSWLDLPPGARRVFLWSMVAGLVGCALVAIFVLLYGEFDRTSGRILGTLAALAFHCAVVVGLAGAGDRGLAPWLVRLGVAAFAVNFGVVIFEIWFPWTYWEGEAIAQTFFLCAAVLLAVPPARLITRGVHQVLAAASLFVCGASLVFGLILLWIPVRVDDVWARAALIAGIAAFTLSHICMLLRLRVAETIRTARVIAIAAAGVTGVLWAIYIGWENASSVFGPSEEFLLRLFAASAVADACATIALLILKRLRRAPSELGESAGRAIVEIRCPRCSSEQRLPLGKSECKACGLKMSIDIESDTCIECGYLLQGLPGRTCPECGTEF